MAHVYFGWKCTHQIGSDYYKELTGQLNSTGLGN